MENYELKKWLSKKINKYDDKTIVRDILDLYFNEILQWISNNNLIIDDNLDSFKINFYSFMYNKYGRI